MDDSAEIIRPEPVEQVMGQDRDAFRRHLEQVDQPTRLDLPVQAARHLLVPEPMLRKARRPDDIAVAIYDSSRLHLRGYVIDRGASLGESRMVKYLESESGEIPTREEFPENLDFYHLDAYRWLIEQGVMKPEDYPVLYISLSSYIPQTGAILRVLNYSDRPQLRNAGVATAFYERLRELAKEMDYWAITITTSAENYFLL